MSQQPFSDSRAFNKATSTYVSYPSQADAMIASLQLSHDIPCHIMDLIISAFTHPDFDAKQVMLRSSIDVIDAVEESRLKDRLAVVHKRSLGEDGRMEQAGFPEFVLDEVLDIIHAERIAEIRYSFKDVWNNESVYKSGRIYEDEILKTMSLVHRSWTIPAQKTLGRILFINRPAGEMIHRLSPVRKSIFGPWTMVVAFHMYCGMDDEAEYDEYYFSYDFREEYRQWFENLHRILVGFTNLRSVWIQSYASFFTKWANRTIGELVQRNTYLKDVMLHAEDHREPFILDSMAQSSRYSKYLNTLNIEGARFSEAAPGKLMQGASFLYLSSLTIKCAFSSLEIDLETLRIISTLSNPCLESLHIICQCTTDFEEITARLFPPAQCAVSFDQLRSVHVGGGGTADRWLKLIGPYCSSLKDVTLDTELLLSADTLSLIPATIQSLHLQGGSWSAIENINQWTKYILLTFSSGHFSELKSFSLLVPGRRLENLDYEFDESRKQEAESLRNQIREYKESIRCLCESAGVECSLDL